MAVTVLRKSVGPYSAGTRVVIENKYDDGTVDLSLYGDVRVYDELLAVSANDLVELRERSSIAKVNNRRERRKTDPNVIAKRMFRNMKADSE